MIIKVCGLTSNASSEEVSKLNGVTHLGFIFYPGSKRYTETSFETVKKKVGVFVNAPISEVKRQIAIHHLDAVQLHGEESPDYISELAASIEIIKAIGIESAEDLNKTRLYEGLITTFLFDTKSPEKGGTGLAFDWSILHQYTGKIPFILSGGLGPNNLERLRLFQHPKLIGYDLNSRFEIAPTVKDVHQIDTFISLLA